MNETPKLTKTTPTLWTARIGDYTANINRTARGTYRVTYFNDESVTIDAENMRDSLPNVAARIGDWHDMQNR